MRTLTLAEARRLAILGTMLAGSRPRSVLEAVRRLGRVQIDPTAAVERAERLTLWSRLGSYPTDDIRRLLEDTRELFEYAAYLAPSEDTPLYRPAMDRYMSPVGARSRYEHQWLQANADFRAYVLEELRARGPLRSRELEDRAEVSWQTGGGWNDGKNLSRMLELLQAAGEITITRREGTERVWDLFERVVPNGRATPLSDEAIAIDTMDRHLRASGILPRGGRPWSAQWFPSPGVGEAAILADGRAVPMAVEGVRGRWMAHADVLAALDGDAWQPRTTLLGPFDPLIADRRRTEALFGFRFRLEIYVPVDKREYGYYVLPILHGDQIIGRIDPVFDRKRQVLDVKAVYSEPEAPADAWPAVNSAIDDLANWLGAQETRLPKLPKPWS